MSEKWSKKTWFYHIFLWPLKAFNEQGIEYNKKIGVPNGIRTRVAGVKGQCPRPLDDGDARVIN